RAGKAGEPAQAFGMGWNVFALVLVGARDEKAVKAAPSEFGAEAFGALAPQGRIGCVVESLEHGMNVWIARGRGNSPIASGPFYPPILSVTQSPIRLRETRRSPWLRQALVTMVSWDFRMPERTSVPPGARRARKRGARATSGRARIFATIRS